MPRFIALLDFTREGIEAIDETLERSEAFKRIAAEMGATVRDLYWTMGGHDGVIVFDAPNGPAASALLVRLGRAGKVSTQTLRAFDRDEMAQILKMAALE